MAEIGFCNSRGQEYKMRKSYRAELDIVRSGACGCYLLKCNHTKNSGESMAKIAKTADRKKVMDTTKSTDCPKCGKPTRIVKRVKDRERGIPGGVFISCSGCEFYEKL